MSDVFWQALIAGIVTVVLATITAMTGLLAARKVEAVKVTLATATSATKAQLDGIADVGHKTHTLVNNAMGVQLKLNAVISRRLAGMTGESADIEAAKAAESLYAEHMAKQAKVDAQK
jgi:hypothetical protein